MSTSVADNDDAWETVNKVLVWLGYDPHNVSSVTVNPFEITITTYERDAQGRLQLDMERQVAITRTDTIERGHEPE